MTQEEENTMRDRAWAFGFDADDFRFYRRGRGRRRRRSFFESGDMKYVILKLLAERPMHGYEVMKELEEHTRGCYKPSPGSVYPTLQWLEDEGLVSSEEKDGKKVYAINDAGRAFLDENKSTVEDIFERVEELMDHLVGEPMPEINRMMGKLVARVYRASWRYRRDDDRRKQVITILETALNEIESLGD